jgi:hypothetical protein
VQRSRITTTSSHAIKDATRFEIARALTRTARDATQAVKDELPKKFTLRRNWVSKGIRFDVAKKVRLVASVYSVDDYMTKQEEGETRLPSGRSLAIPVDARRNERSPILPSLFPRRALSRKDVFKSDMERTGWGIFQRMNTGIRILYLLRPRKHTKPRWELESTVDAVVQKRFEMNLN